MFAQHYIPALHRFATSRLRGEPELVREVVQTTICQVIERLDSWRAEAPLFTWLCACCRNEIAMHFRRNKPGRDVELHDNHFSPAPGPDDVTLTAESAALVHEALDHLPPHYARALEAKYIDGMSVEGIARELHLSAKAAESVLTRARDAFRAVYRNLTEVKTCVMK
jgi:RNA polymerase sigma-70 factor (ECF subfamily)